MGRKVFPIGRQVVVSTWKREGHEVVPKEIENSEAQSGKMRQSESKRC